MYIRGVVIPGAGRDKGGGPIREQGFVTGEGHGQKRQWHELMVPDQLGQGVHQAG